MKNKKLVIIILVVVIVLAGTVALASFDEEGNFINPFTNILAKKVEDGSITQAEVDTFNKVLATIHEDDEFVMDNRRMPYDKEAMARESFSTVIDQLVEDGLLTSEQALLLNEHQLGINRETLETLTEEEAVALREAMAILQEQKGGFGGRPPMDFKGRKPAKGNRALPES